MKYLLSTDCVFSYGSEAVQMGIAKVQKNSSPRALGYEGLKIEIWSEGPPNSVNSSTPLRRLLSIMGKDIFVIFAKFFLLTEKP